MNNFNNRNNNNFMNRPNNQGNNNLFNNFNKLMSMGNNPQQILQNAMNGNPQLTALFNQQKQSGMSMEQFTRQFAKQNNIDIEPMINMLKSRGMKF